MAIRFTKYRKVSSSFGKTKKNKYYTNWNKGGTIYPVYIRNPGEKRETRSYHFHIPMPEVSSPPKRKISVKRRALNKVNGRDNYHR